MCCLTKIVLCAETDSWNTLQNKICLSVVKLGEDWFLSEFNLDDKLGLISGIDYYKYWIEII